MSLSEIVGCISDNEPLVECELCHDLHDVYQLRVTWEGYCYCDKCLFTDWNLLASTATLC